MAIDTKRVKTKKGVITLDNIKIARRLVELRGNKSREDVAHSVNISCSALSMYEQGNRIPRDEIKVRLANYYGTTVQDIFFTN